MNDAARRQGLRCGRWWVRGLRGLREVWVGVGVTLVALGMAEGAARLVWAVRAQPADRRIHADGYPAEPWVAQMFDENRRCAHLRWEPYVYWRRTPCSGRYVNVDAAGLRRTWALSVQPGRRPLRIFFFGGSTAWGTGVRDEHTIPSELAQYLARAGTYAEVVNYGETGYVGTQEVIALLRELQRGHRPDLALFYLGQNDTFTAIADSGVAMPMNELHRRQEFNVLHHSKRLAAEVLRALASHSALGLLIAAHAAPPRTALAARPGAAEDLMRSLDVNVRTVRGLAASYGFAAAFYWEPCILTKTFRTAYEERAAAEPGPPREWVLDIYARVRRAWAASGNSDLTYLGDIFAATREPRFVDHSHTSETANRELAAAIGRRLIDDAMLLPAATGKPASAASASRREGLPSAAAD